MLNIIIPNNNFPEREYIIRIIFSNYLGLPYKITTSESNLRYSIHFDDSELEISDSFFGLYPDSLSYLTKDALPKEIIFVKNEFTFENDIPVIYGTGEIHASENKINCGIDIFSSSFFMLTRWEEYVDKARDERDRFPGKSSVAFKHNYLHRPVVNEYIEMLWLMLQSLGFQGERKQRSYELVLTHDVDHLDYPRMPRIILSDVLKMRSFKLANEHISYYWKSGSNPYDYFDFLMTISEKVGVKSHFYFMSSNSKQPQDPRLYLKGKRFKSKITEIKTRGHIIGFHPGYYTYDNPKRWSDEKALLEGAAQEEIIEGRQHYLRFDVAKTLRIWDNNKMEIDSTMGYAQAEGFRCGTGDIFAVFDFLERTQMNVKERPLIVMDGTLRQYKQYSLEEASAIIQKYIAIGEKYKSAITLLFHNSSFYGLWEGYSKVYSEIINYSKKDSINNLQFFR